MGKVMRAAVYDGKELKLTDRFLRDLAVNEILLKNVVCGICGTDIRIIAGQSHVTPPVVLGHEYCGYVIEIGANVTDLEPGDFVAVDPNIYCGKCQYCRRGQVNLCENLKALGVDIRRRVCGILYCARRGSVIVYRTMSIPFRPFSWKPLSCALYGFQKLPSSLARAF
jgi:threonine dehydrogenase-like Zn-dependent dehydrogenase